jgi:hypothetical protein
MHPELQKEINRYVNQGYRVVSQTETTAQLIRPKQFSCLFASLWFLLFGVGLLFYLFYYWSKKDDTIYLQLVNGRVIRK